MDKVIDESPVLRTLCYMLRHNPTPYRVKITDDGWANIDRVLAALRARNKTLCLWQPWTHKQLRAFVKKHQPRFEICKNRIRARYGHSLPITIGNVKPPPEILYHGTTDVYMNSIRMLGLRAYRRTFVHLTSDPAYAEEVADSAEGRSIILTVRASEAAYTGDITFRQATDLVWLVTMLPACFVDLSAGQAFGEAQLS